MREKENDSLTRRQLEIDFIASLGSVRYYIQSAYDMRDEEKIKQETRPFDKTNDSFKKIIVVGRNIKPRHSENGYLIIGIKEFLLKENSLEF